MLALVPRLTDVEGGDCERRFHERQWRERGAFGDVEARCPGRKVVELASFEASPQGVAAAVGTVPEKAVAPVIAPHEEWAGILRGNGFSPEVAAAFVAMYDGINAGIVSPQSGMERRQGKSALAKAARNLVLAT